VSPATDPGLGFLIKHWRGQQSLARGFWLNGVLPLTVLTGAIPVSQRVLPAAGVEPFALRVLLVSGLILFVGSWAAVGIWRSAGTAARNGGRKRWTVAAKGVTLGGAIATMVVQGPLARDHLAILLAIHSPGYAEFSVEPAGDGEIILTGALSDDSADAAIVGLTGPRPVLRLDSHGGLIEPAMRLARLVRERGVTVIVEGECRSACLFVLAASPKAAMAPGTAITFHQVQPIADYTSDAMRARHARYVEEVAGYYREFGVPERAIARMERDGVWSPTIPELIEMGLIDLIRDPLTGALAPARAYCAAHPAECGE
jgi:hypothetical protein